MIKPRRVILIAAVIVLLVVAPSCRRATPTPTPLSVPPTARPTSTPAPTPTPVPTATPTPVPTSTPEPTEPPGACGQEGSWIVLVVGEALPEDVPDRGAGALRLVRVDFDARTVRVLSVPPYLWVDTMAMSSVQIEATTLALAYEVAMQTASGTDQERMAEAADVLALVVNHNLGVMPDHTVALRQGAFIDMIDTLGGLSIDLPADVDGSAGGFGVYTAGPQVLDGAAVLDYMSVFQAVGDEPPLELARLERQNQVVQALVDQLTSAETLLKLPALIRQFEQDVVTDLDLEQLLALGCLLAEEDVSIEYMQIGPDLVTPGVDKILFPKTEEIIDYIQTEFLEVE
jgi:hypothetical protein